MNEPAQPGSLILTADYVPVRFRATRSSDQTMADDYFATMNSVEQRLELIDKQVEPVPIFSDERAELLALADQLAAPDLGVALRYDLVSQLRSLLCKNTFELPP